MNDPGADVPCAATATPGVVISPGNSPGHDLPAPPIHASEPFVLEGGPTPSSELDHDVAPEFPLEHVTWDATMTPARSSDVAEDIDQESSSRRVYQTVTDREPSRAADPVLSIQLVWYFKEVPGKWCVAC